MRKSYLQRQRLFARWTGLFLASLLLGLAACGSGDSPASDSVRYGSEELEFFINWHSSPGSASAFSDSRTVQALSDCAREGVATVQCSIYEDAYTFMIEGPQWPCEDHNGTLDGIFPGSDLIMVCLGRDAAGNIVHQGQKEGITVRAGEVTDTINIDSHSFAATHREPEDGSTNLSANRFDLIWEEVPNAQLYLLEVENLASGDIRDEPVDETSFRPGWLEADTAYSWNVTPVDRFGNEGLPSEPWEFQTAPGETCLAPDLTPIGPQNAQEDVELSFTIEAEDLDGDNDLSYSADNLANLPGTATLGPTGEFSWTPPQGSAGEYSVTFRVSNPCPGDAEPLEAVENIVIIVTAADEPQSCTFTISSEGEEYDYNSHPGTFDVLPSRTDCAWSASVTVGTGWIAITSGESGTGEGPVTYQVLANGTPSQRTGRISVAGQTHTITQQPAPAVCTFQVSSDDGDFTADGGTGTINVDASQEDCDWSASVTVGADWITITSDASGTGDGTVDFEVSANDTASVRNGTIDVEGESHPVTQQGTEPTNTPPTISEIGDVTVYDDPIHYGYVSFNISDQETTDSNQLDVSYQMSPISGFWRSEIIIPISETGDQWYFEFSTAYLADRDYPIPIEETCTVTITVSDGSLSDSTTFTITYFDSGSSPAM